MLVSCCLRVFAVMASIRCIRQKRTMSLHSSWNDRTCGVRSLVSSEHLHTQESLDTFSNKCNLMYIYPDHAQKSHRITGVGNKETHQKYFTRTTSALFNALHHLHVCYFQQRELYHGKPWKNNLHTLYAGWGV